MTLALLEGTPLFELATQAWGKEKWARAALLMLLLTLAETLYQPL